MMIHNALANRRLRRLMLFGVVGLAAAAAVFGSVSAATGGEKGNVVEAQMVEGSYGDLVRSISAIDRPRTSADQLPPSLASVFATMAGTANGADPGAAELALKVFSAPGPGAVFVAPVPEGFAFLSEAGGGGAIRGVLGDTNPIAGGVFDAGPNTRAVAWGIAIDSVVRVEIVVGDKVYEAEMLKNGYVWTAPDDKLDLDRFIMKAYLDDGTVVIT